jgi:antitoxin component of RelBE/YafQ-DinJ toxin-antitoxin module
VDKEFSRPILDFGPFKGKPVPIDQASTSTLQYIIDNYALPSDLHTQIENQLVLRKLIEEVDA